MGRGGRFGKYGEHKRFERLRLKQRTPLPSKTIEKFPKRKPSNYKKR